MADKGTSLILFQVLLPEPRIEDCRGYHGSVRERMFSRDLGPRSQPGEVLLS